MKIVIPARRGTKGLPLKNRVLLEDTLSIIPACYRSSTIVSTDDDFILEKAMNYEVKVVRRSDDASSDKASIKSVLMELIKNKEISCNEVIVVLYLTYPEREWEEVEDVLRFFKRNKSKSLLCRKEVRVSPFLCLLEDHTGLHGTQITPHNLYRRQDYPTCFEISHYVIAMLASEVEALNDNLYNENTFFYKIADKIDIDLPKDLELYRDKNNS